MNLVFLQADIKDTLFQVMKQNQVGEENLKIYFFAYVALEDSLCVL